MNTDKSPEEFAQQYASIMFTLTTLTSLAIVYYVPDTLWNKVVLSLLYGGIVGTAVYLVLVFLIHLMYSDFYLYLVKAFAAIEDVDDVADVEDVQPVTATSHRVFQVVTPPSQSNVPAQRQNNQRDTNVTQDINNAHTTQILDSDDDVDDEDDVEEIDEDDVVDDDALPVPVVRVHQTQSVNVSLGNRELTRYLENVLSGPFVKLGDSNVKYDGHPNYLRRLFDYYWNNREDTFSKTSFAEYAQLNRFDKDVRNQLEIMEKWLGQHGLLSNSVRNNRRCLTDLGMKVLHPPTPSV
jgi:hypothetical protein